MSKEIIGYTTGVYDLFHIGHLTLLKNAKGLCDRLIVGVTVDELVSYKGKHAMIPFEDRIEIVRSIKYVDAAIPQYDMDKLKACKKLGASILFVGDDWYATDKWKEYEKEFEKEGIRIVYFPYTRGISSTKITNALKSVRGWSNEVETMIKPEHVVDKSFCMSSYLTFRYIIDDNVDFYDNINHKTITMIPESKRIQVKTSKDIDIELQKQFDRLKGKKLGILLSGGMDSACLASYMTGQDAYTFRFDGGEFQKEELARAEHYASVYKLRLHYVDISWDNVIYHIDNLMKVKGAPVHSIEPQIAQAALQAKNDGIDMMIIGDAADYVFGGMNELHAKDWTYDEFKARFTYIEPSKILNECIDMDFAFEKYRKDDKIDYISLMHEYTDIESYSSYDNAFNTVDMDYLDPYEILIMSEPLDLARIRNGESKYLIRELFRMKYPDMTVPEKLPMPRPVDKYFVNWNGPSRYEFKKNIDMNEFSGNQKWLMWCLERFLNNNEK